MVSHEQIGEDATLPCPECGGIMRFEKHDDALVTLLANDPKRLRELKKTAVSAKESGHRKSAGR